MVTDFSLIIPRASKLSQKFDNTSLLLSNHWVLVDQINSKKILYIFRNNNELLISEGGRVELASWRYLGISTFIIEKEKEKKLYKYGFFDQNIIAVRYGDDQSYLFFVNEKKFDQGLNSKNEILNYFNSQYFDNKISKKITRRKRKSLSNKKNNGFYNYNFRYNYNYVVTDKIIKKNFFYKKLKKLFNLQAKASSKKTSIKIFKRLII